MMKTCSICGQMLSLDNFHKRKEGLRGTCKDCRRAQNKKYREKTKKNYSERHLLILENRKLKEVGQKTCTKCKLTKDISLEFFKGSASCKSCFKEYYNLNKIEILEKNKQSHYKNKFGGITRKDLGTECTICFKTSDLVIDHCHEKDTIRGLLCRQCNAALGLLQDNKELTKRAWRYLCGSLSKEIIKSNFPVSSKKN